MAMAALLLVVATAVVSMALVLAGRAQASNAADAAALAAAVASYPSASQTTPSGAAGSMARHNGAALVSCACPVDASLSARVVEVVVEVAVEVPLFGEVSVRSSARAEFDPRLWLGR